MQTQTTKIQVVRPVDQLRPTTRPQYDDNTIVGKAHNLFLRRMSFHHFHIAKFDRLIKVLEQALEQSPDNAQLKYELAWSLVQNRADGNTLRRANQLITEILTDQRGVGLDQASNLSADTLAEAHRLKLLIEKMQNNAITASRVQPPRRVNWAVYNRCPMVCMGCYNNFSPDQLTIKQAKVGLEKLADAGVRELIISGGDPILWPDLPEFIEHAYQLGFAIGVDTTGYTLTEELLQRVGPLLRYIGLPLDGSTNKIENGFRRGPKDIVDKTKRNLEWCSRHSIPVKINTIVTQYNINDLTEIGRVIIQYPTVQNWSLFQWLPIRATTRLREQFSVPPELFDDRVSQLHDIFPHLHIRTRSGDDRELTHFFIQNNGQVLTFGSNTNEEFILGHILHDDVETMVQSPVFNKSSSKYKTTDRFSVNHDHVLNTVRTNAPMLATATV